MHVFITGSTGFVGSWLVRHFAAKGWQITSSGRRTPPSQLLQQASFVHADVREPMPLHRADVVVHAAALASDLASLKDLQAANVDGTRHVFEATRDCRIFVYISSASVYDYRDTAHKENEVVDYQSLSNYGLSKRQAEDWLSQQNWDKRTLIILRPRAVYGTGDRVLLPRLMRLVWRGRICSPGDMRIQSSLTWVGNLCAAVECCINHFEKQPGGIQIFNVADAGPYEMREVVCRLLSAVYGSALSFFEIPLAPLRAICRISEYLKSPTQFTRVGLSAVSRSFVLDCEKIKNITHYQPGKNLWDIIPEISAWVNIANPQAVRAAMPDLPWQGIE